MSKLTQAQIDNYKLNEEEIKMIDGFQLAMAGEEVNNIPKMKDFLSTPSAQILMPQVTIGTM